MKKPWYELVTRRGWIVLISLGLILLFALVHATGDICWVGDGYGSCSNMVDQVVSNG